MIKIRSGRYLFLHISRNHLHLWSIQFFHLLFKCTIRMSLISCQCKILSYHNDSPKPKITCQWKCSCRYRTAHIHCCPLFMIHLIHAIKIRREFPEEKFLSFMIIHYCMCCPHFTEQRYVSAFFYCYEFQWLCPVYNRIHIRYNSIS